MLNRYKQCFISSIEDTIKSTISSKNSVYDFMSLSDFINLALLGKIPQVIMEKSGDYTFLVPEDKDLYAIWKSKKYLLSCENDEDDDDEDDDEPKYRDFDFSKDYHPDEDEDDDEDEDEDEVGSDKDSYIRYIDRIHTQHPKITVRTINKILPTYYKDYITFTKARNKIPVIKLARIAKELKSYDNDNKKCAPKSNSEYYTINSTYFRDTWTRDVELDLDIKDGLCPLVEVREDVFEYINPNNGKAPLNGGLYICSDEHRLILQLTKLCKLYPNKRFGIGVLEEADEDDDDEDED